MLSSRSLCDRVLVGSSEHSGAALICAARPCAFRLFAGRGAVLLDGGNSGAPARLSRLQLADKRGTEHSDKQQERHSQSTGGPAHSNRTISAVSRVRSLAVVFEWVQQDYCEKLL